MSDPQPTTGPTPEQMLAAVIEAQVRGGCKENDYLVAACGRKVGNHDRFYLDLKSKSFEMHDWEDHDRVGILEILLDPQGLRAAYGDEMLSYGVSFYEPGNRPASESLSLGDNTDAHLGLQIPGCDGAWLATPKWLVAAQEILHAWVSKPDGDAEVAIRTAYELLPKF